MEAVGPMIDDVDVFRAANMLIKQYGDDAPIRAAQRADEMLEQGDIDGQVVWKRILAAVEELSAKERPEGAVVH